mgnify:FL=1
MNASTPRPQNAPIRAGLVPARPEPRQRAMCVGYGSSSGYVRRAPYARSSLSPRFRVS